MPAFRPTFSKSLAKPARLALHSLPLVVAVALGVRLWAFWVHQQDVPHYILSSMPWFYEPGAIARSLALGKGFSNPFRIGGDTGPTAWFAPVYPLVAAGLIRLFGVDSFAAYTACVVLNAVCSALACVPLYFVARRIAGRGVAAGSAWAWALFPNAIIVSYEWIWDTSISALLGVSLLWATIVIDTQAATESFPREEIAGEVPRSVAGEKSRADAGAGRGRKAWVGYGLLWGVSLMTNPSLISLLPFLVGWVVWRRHVRAVARSSQVSGQADLPRPRSRVWGGPGLALAVMAACCLPWTIRNFVVFHSFVPLRSVMGLELWLGNNDKYVDDFPGWLHPVQDKAERQQYVRMGEIAYMRAKQRQAIHWMLGHPGRVARISMARAVAFWAGVPDPWTEFRRSSSALVRLLLVSNSLLGVGAFAGVFILWRRRSPYAVPAAAFPVVFPCVYYLTQALLRYRIPIDPVVILLTAIAIGAVFRAAVRRQPPSPGIGRENAGGGWRNSRAQTGAGERDRLRSVR